MQTSLAQAKQYRTCDLPEAKRLSAAPDRRSFLFGSAGALLAAFSTTAGAQSRALSAAGAASATSRPESLFPPAAVGYWAGPDSEVISAARLTQGDRTMIKNGVHVTVHGLSFNSVEPQIAEATLLAHFRTDPVSEPNKFYAWRYSQEVLYYPESEVGFFMPLQQTHEIALSLDYFWQDDPERNSPVRRCEDVLRLSVEPQDGKLKLRPGLYFIALPDLRQPALPNWEACRFSPKYRADSLVGGTLAVRTPKGMKTLLNPYLMLSVTPVYPANPEQDREEVDEP